MKRQASADCGEVPSSFAAYAQQSGTPANTSNVAPFAEALPKFHTKILFQAPRNDGHPNFHKPDMLLLKEYEEWKKHASHIEHLCAIRLRGCTTLQFLQACIQANSEICESCRVRDKENRHGKRVSVDHHIWIRNQ